MSLSKKNWDVKPDHHEIILATKIHSLINNDKISITNLEREFEGIPKERRRKIVNYRIKKKAALFVACEKENLAVIKYLVKDCGADVEQRGHYQHLPFHFEDEVPALWFAAEKDSLDVVRSLTNLGANINCTSSTSGTALLVGCLHNSEKTVRYLVDHGASLNKPNIYGVTPLLNASSKGSLELCKFLIEKGADCNLKDSNGRNALHRALEEKRLEIVQLLLRSGVDHSAKNDTGENVLRMASLKGCEDIVEYMIETLTLSPQDKIEAYELLGSHHVIETNEYEDGYNCWEKSIELRKKNDLPKVRSSGRLGQYIDFKEFIGMDDLRLCIGNKEVYNMQALLIRERILGTSHTEAVWTMDYCGAVYADTNQYQKCINIWKFGYRLLLEKGDAFDDDCIFRIQALMKVFLDNEEDYIKSLSTEKLSIADVLEVFDMLLTNIRLGKMIFMQRPWEKNTSKRYLTLMIMPLQLIKLLMRLVKTEKENQRFTGLVKTLVKLNPTDEYRRSLLQLSFCPSTSKTDEYTYQEFPCAKVSRMLIDCEADINHMDYMRDTPLLNCARLLGDITTDADVRDIISYMMDIGAHVDTCNNEGQCALNLLLLQGFSFSPVNYRTLKCCAATAVMQNKLPYRDYVPKSLIPFIECHGKCNMVVS